jgi:outer membrane protein OmpA-like peptidoglycan-associated protein
LYYHKLDENLEIHIYKKMKRVYTLGGLLLFAFFFFFSGTSPAQCIEGHCACTCMPLHETFGSAPTCDSPQNTSNAGIVNHTFIPYNSGHSFIPYTSGWEDDNPADGEYTIRCNADELQAGWHLSPWADHTDDGGNVGFAAIINSGRGPREFYHKTLTGLCAASTYTVSFYAGNLTQTKSNTDLTCNYVNLPSVSTYTFPANTSVQTESNKTTASFLISNRIGGALLGTTPEMSCTPPASGMPWNLYSYEFTTGASQTSIDIVLVSLHGYNAGWDFSIDDIVVKKKIDCPAPRPELPVVIPPKAKPQPKAKPPVAVPSKPVKKDTVAQIVATSADFKKDISIDDIKVDQKLQLSHIYFERAKFNLLSASFPELNDLVIFMKKYPTVRIRLEGHTDNQGEPQLNLELSEKRAKEVKKYLVAQGIDENRIEWIGYGGQKPTNSDGNEYFRQKNRRVEVVIIGK